MVSSPPLEPAFYLLIRMPHAQDGASTTVMNVTLARPAVKAGRRRCLPSSRV